MPKRLTKRDVSLIRHVEKYGFITISQAASIEFNSNKYAYDLARRRLSAIEELGYLQSTEVGMEKVFYIEDKYSKPSLHMIVTMNLYSRLVEFGAEILYFKREQQWTRGLRRSDAFCIYKKSGYYYSVAAETLESSSRSRGETPFTHNDKYRDKYLAIRSSDEHNKIFQQITNRTDGVPLNLLIIDNVDHGEEWNIKVSDILTFTDDFKLKNIYQLF